MRGIRVSSLNNQVLGWCNQVFTFVAHRHKGASQMRIRWVDDYNSVLKWGQNCVQFLSPVTTTIEKELMVVHWIVGDIDGLWTDGQYMFWGVYVTFLFKWYSFSYVVIDLNRWISFKCLRFWFIESDRDIFQYRCLFSRTLVHPAVV